MEQESKAKLIFPIVLIVLGAGILLDNVGVWNFWNIVGDWWPLIIIIAGLATWQGDKKATGPVITMIIGFILLLWTVDVIPAGFSGVFWPAMLIVIGIIILTKRSKDPTGATDAERINIQAIFGGINKKVTSPSFKGGSVSAVFGGGELDLRQAHIQDKAVLNVTAVFGGCEIFVPKSIKINVQGTPILGGWEDKTSSDNQADKTLIIKGVAMFGGVEIKN